VNLRRGEFRPRWRLLLFLSLLPPTPEKNKSFQHLLLPKKGDIHHGEILFNARQDVVLWAPPPPLGVPKGITNKSKVTADQKRKPGAIFRRYANQFPRQVNKKKRNLATRKSFRWLFLKNQIIDVIKEGVVGKMFLLFALLACVVSHGRLTVVLPEKFITKGNDRACFSRTIFTAFGDWRRNIQIIFTISGWRENARGAISSSSLTFTRRGKMRAKCLSLSYKVEGNERDTMMMMGVNTKQQAGPQHTKPIPLPINHDPFSFFFTRPWTVYDLSSCRKSIETFFSTLEKRKSPVDWTVEGAVWRASGCWPQMGDAAERLTSQRGGRSGSSAV
jgi:hypothetical protein